MATMTFEEARTLLKNVRRESLGDYPAALNTVARKLPVAQVVALALEEMAGLAAELGEARGAYDHLSKRVDKLVEVAKLLLADVRGLQGGAAPAQAGGSGGAAQPRTEESEPEVAGPPPPAPGGAHIGSNGEPLTAEEIEREQMMDAAVANMPQQGAGGDNYVPKSTKKPPAAKPAAK